MRGKSYETIFIETKNLSPPFEEEIIESLNHYQSSVGVKKLLES